MAEKGDCMVLIVMGMAGSGKTTFVSKLYKHFSSQQQKCFLMNLDPAVLSLPYTPDIDIRTMVSYAGVREQYKLGPNGGILTCFNIFATHFNKVMESLEEKCTDCKYIIVDTPGQIEVFTWSASGVIITDMLASRFATTMTYMLDTPRNTSATTFTCNMLHACSIQHKSPLLPFLLVLNKIDVTPSTTLLAWMEDFDVFSEALQSSSSSSSYMNNLCRSLSLVLDEYYCLLSTCSVSSISGEGMEKMAGVLEKCSKLYYSDYKKDRDERMLLKKEKESQHSSSETPLPQTSSSTDTSSSAANI